jgi:hypothetical protein
MAEIGVPGRVLALRPDLQGLVVDGAATPFRSAARRPPFDVLAEDRLPPS